MSCPDPFIPAALDDAGLTPHQFRVFCRIARRGDCTESVGRIAEATQMNEKTVRAALRGLIERSMVARTERPGTTNVHEVNPPSTWKDPSQKKGDPQNRESQKKGDHPSHETGEDPSQKKGWASKGYPLEGYPLEGSYSVVEIEISTAPPWWRGRVKLGLLGPLARRRATKLPGDHPARSERHLRYRKAAEWSLDLLLQAEEAIESFRVPSAVRRKADRDRLGLLKNWQDIFRLLEEQDCHDWSNVRYAIHWLFTQSDWLREGYIASMGSLRNKTSSGDQTKFEAILTQAQADSSYDGPNDEGQIGRDGRAEFGPAQRFERNRRAARRAVAAG